MGLDSPLPDLFFLRDLLSGNLMLPRLDLQFLNLNDYIRRNYVLFKASIVASLWETLGRQGPASFLLMEELVPEFLPAVPRDPFLPGEPLRLLPRSGGRWWLYSVGPDRVDQRATQLLDRHATRGAGDIASEATYDGEPCRRPTHAGGTGSAPASR